MQNAKLILTDSGGIQEEASYLKMLIGNNFNKLKIHLDRILKHSYKKGQDIEKWDGKTSQRIVEIIEDESFKTEIKHNLEKEGIETRPLFSFIPHQLSYKYLKSEY